MHFRKIFVKYISKITNTFKHLNKYIWKFRQICAIVKHVLGEASHGCVLLDHPSVDMGHATYNSVRPVFRTVSNWFLICGHFSWSPGRGGTPVQLTRYLWLLRRVRCSVCHTMPYYGCSVQCKVSSGSWSGWLDRFNSLEGFTAHRWVSTKLGFPKNSSILLFI